MENIIQQLRDLNSDSFIIYCIKKWIDTGASAECILGEIRSIAADNPLMLERTLGIDLFNQIIHQHDTNSRLSGN
jgi:hypothetical protein